MSPESNIVILTDGSSRGNPGPGGFGAIVIADGRVTELGGREVHTTNNRMELRAAIEALSFLSKVKGQRSIGLFSDSSYLINGITRWIRGWQKNGWKTAGKKEVENRDLWERLMMAAEGREIEWKRVGGHSGVAGNERCDEIAAAFADGKKPKLYSGVLENYRIKKIFDMHGTDSSAAEKSSSPRRSRAKAYSYVSAVDGAVTVHKTWAECEARVKGARGAKYRKVFSSEEERLLVSEWSETN
ncbi:MAG: ribonuclease H [Parcubacteria group bacterium Greene0416_79]|nr:MAG: ribonuclease H [Parcubacteria group bacterium Greene0416_79]